MLTILALSFANMVLRDREPGALDEQTAALRATSVFGGMPGHISDIGVLQSFGVSDRLGSFQGFDRRRRQVFQQVQRMKAREVDRNVTSQIGFDPRTRSRNSVSPSFSVGTTRCTISIHLASFRVVTSVSSTG